MLQFTKQKVSIAIISCCLFFSFTVNAQVRKPANGKVFMGIFDKFVEEDKKGIDSTNLVLFVGSSTFTKWTNLQSYFPMSNVLNRGFGGSKLTDVIYYADKVVYPYKPAQIVLYEGDNDTGSGISADALFADLKVFLRWTDIKLPKVPVVLVAVKYSPKRHKFRNEVDAYNLKMKELAASNPQYKYADIAAITINENGTYKSELFTADSLHVNEACYKLYGKVLEPLLLKK